MIDWSVFDAETVFRGKSPEGTPYLLQFLRDYKRIVNPAEAPVASCKKCVQKYLNQLINFKKMDIKISKNWKLKAKYEGITLFGTGIILTNSNITDELAERFYKEHPAKENLFDLMPEELPSEDAPSDEDMTLSELKEMYPEITSNSKKGFLKKLKETQA